MSDAPPSSRRGGPSSVAVPGRVLVAVFLLLLGLGLFFAFAIWLAARRPWNANASTIGPPGARREDVAGQALVQVLHTCLAETSLREPVHLRLRVTLAPTGEAKFTALDLNVADGTLAPCSRRAATLIRTAPAPAGSPPVPLEVRFDSELEPDSTRVTRTRWQ